MRQTIATSSPLVASVLMTGLALAGAASAVAPQSNPSGTQQAEAPQQAQPRPMEGNMGMMQGDGNMGMQEGGNMGMMQRGGMFASMDLDKDGSVTRDEAAEFHAAQFKKWDTDGDSVINRQESMAGMKAMHANGCCPMSMSGGMMDMMGKEGMCSMEGMPTTPKR